MAYRRSRYENSSNHQLKKFGIIVFPLAIILTITALAYGGFVGNFIGYMMIGCVIFVGLFYIMRFLSS